MATRNLLPINVQEKESDCRWPKDRDSKRFACLFLITCFFGIVSFFIGYYEEPNCDAKNFHDLSLSGYLIFLGISFGFEYGLTFITMFTKFGGDIGPTRYAFRIFNFIWLIIGGILLVDNKDCDDFLITYYWFVWVLSIFEIIGNLFACCLMATIGQWDGR